MRKRWFHSHGYRAYFSYAIFTAWNFFFLVFGLYVLISNDFLSDLPYFIIGVYSISLVMFGCQFILCLKKFLAMSEIIKGKEQSLHRRLLEVCFMTKLLKAHLIGRIRKIPATSTMSSYLLDLDTEKRKKISRNLRFFKKFYFIFRYFVKFYTIGSLMQISLRFGDETYYFRYDSLDGTMQFVGILNTKTHDGAGTINI